MNKTNNTATAASFAATLAKFFIIMTLIFEIITMASGSILYSVFVIVSAFILCCIIIQFAVPRITKYSAQRKAQEKHFPLSGAKKVRA